MSKIYAFDYLDENAFRKKERSIKKYNMLAYKKLLFEYYPKLREGEFLERLVKINKKDKYKSYELKLPSLELFSKVHGDIMLYYNVYEEEGIIKFINITPDELLEQCYSTELPTYKGVPITKETDKFKIDLLNMLSDRY